MLILKLKGDIKMTKISEIKLAVFDFDATIMDGETINFLAKEAKVEDEVSKITHLAMNGQIDFFESLIKRVSLLKGLSEKKVNDICQNLPIINGAKELVSYLKNNNVTVVCLSGGFKNATEPICKKLGFDATFSNTLHVKEGFLTGLVGGEMMFSDSKGRMINKIQNLLNINNFQTIVCGDGANDISMCRYSSHKVAFCAKEALKNVCNYHIEIKDLSKIINIFEK